MSASTNNQYIISPRAHREEITNLFLNAFFGYNMSTAGLVGLFSFAGRETRTCMFHMNPRNETQDYKGKFVLKTQPEIGTSESEKLG